MTVHPMLIRAAATPAEQRYLDLYASVADRLPGHDRPEVRVSREAALDAFALRGLPHRRVEEWKYTDLRTLMPEPYPLGGLDEKRVVSVDLAEWLGAELAALDVYRAVFHNGRFHEGASTIQDAPGVTAQIVSRDITPLSVPQADKSHANVLALLSTAFATDGLSLTVRAGSGLDKPIQLIMLGETPASASFALAHTIIVEETASATVIETIASRGSVQAFTSTSVRIAKGGSLRHTRIGLGPDLRNLGYLNATLETEAAYDQQQLAFGGILTRADGLIRFTGEGGRAHYTGAMLARGGNHVDFTLVVDHDAVGCESRELVKAVLDGRSRGVFQGKVVVQKGAQKTDGKQMANALLLSDEAEFDSKPELEIYADDVTCGHGATAGQLDDDLLFYLRARGIPEAEARAMLIASFVGEALERIESEPLRDALDAHVQRWLAAGGTQPAL
jgi:Fe-S cluster assembly protein SufD